MIQSFLAWLGASTRWFFLSLYRRARNRRPPSYKAYLRGPILTDPMDVGSEGCVNSIVGAIVLAVILSILAALYQ